MAYQRGDYRYGNQYRSQDRWRDRERGSRYGSGQGYREDDDRGFFDRAGDQVRSWFGDEEAESRRDRAVRRWEREQRALADRYRPGRRTRARRGGKECVSACRSRWSPEALIK